MLPNGNPSSTKRGSRSGAAPQEEKKEASTSQTSSVIRPSTSTQKDRGAQSRSRAWLATPAPIKRLFAHFPLQTLPTNRQPSCRHDDRSTAAHLAPAEKGSREKKSSDLPVLHIFSTPAAAAQGAPSFNPSCLQHQTWLRAQGVRTRAVCSSNHAAPTGVLPFLVLGTEQRVVPAAKMWEWAVEQSDGKSTKSKRDPVHRAREAAYLALIEHRLRAAWLLALYLTPSNFAALCRPLYIDPATSAAPVRAALASDLHSAAVTALHSLSPPTGAARQRSPPSVLPEMLVGEAFPTTKDAERIYTAASEALGALSELLGADAWFFDSHCPGRLDVVLFSYVHLMCDESLREQWADRRLVELLQAKDVQNLVKHRERMLTEVWGSDPTVVAPRGM